MKRQIVLIALVVTLLLPLHGSLARVAPAPTIVYIDQSNTSGTPSGTIGNPFPDIYRGIDTVNPGGTVIVAPGTYVETLVIDKNVTLRGSGWDVTTIDGSLGKGTSTIAISGTAQVTVEHFKITGARPPSGEATAGIKGRTGASFNARWNWFTGNAQNGVVSYGPDVIERNLFTNNATDTSGYAIWASSSSTAQIHNNTIRRTTNHIGETGSNPVDAGIAIWSRSTYYPATPDIRNNIVYNVLTGILSTDGSPAAGTIVDYNIVYSNTTNYAGLTQGTHDQIVDPKLTSSTYLNTGSPAIDGGDPDPAFNDRDGTRNDVGVRQYYMAGYSSYGNWAVPSARQTLGLALYPNYAVWTSSYIHEPGIYRQDIDNGDPFQSLSVPGFAGSDYGGLAYDRTSGILYHSSIYGDGIHKLNPGTGAISETLPFSVIYGSDLAFDGMHLWQAAGGWQDPDIYRIDAATGAVVDSFVSPVPGQTQTFGLTYGDDSLWLSKDQVIYRIDPASRAIVCSFKAPVADVRGLAFLSGKPSSLLASSFTHDRVVRVSIPSSCYESAAPSKIYAKWSPQASKMIGYQAIYGNEGACVPRRLWATTTIQSGDELPKTIGQEIRGLRLSPSKGVPVTVVELSNASLTDCGDGTWAVWSRSASLWEAAAGTLTFDWNPPPEPGIQIYWSAGDSLQTVGYQHRVANENICTPRAKDWESISLESGDYLPTASDPVVHNYSGLRLQLAHGDTLEAEVLSDNTTLTPCGDGLWVIWSVSPADFAAAYGEIWATWEQFSPGHGIQVGFKGTGAGEPHELQWQPISEAEGACKVDRSTWISATIGPGGKLPTGAERGVRVKLSQDDLLGIHRAGDMYAQPCGGGVYAFYAVNTELWLNVQAVIEINWAALYLDLDCTWIQHTETVDHARGRGSHLWCTHDGTVTVTYEDNSTDSVEVVDGYASIPSGVKSVKPGGALVDTLTATLKDRLPVTMHIVPVDLVDVDIDAPTVGILLLAFDLVNLPFFDISWVIEDEIDVAGDTDETIWANMGTAMNGQPAVVGTDAYMLVASSADEPEDLELWFGQGPFDSWKGMFFLEHPTTFIHELLHSLLGLQHVGWGAGGPDPDWPYGATRTFPEESTFKGFTEPGNYERLHFTGNDCDALMSYGNSNPYGLGSDYRVRCLSPFNGEKAWDGIDDYLALAVEAIAPSAGPVMWLEGPDLYKFTLAHTASGDTGTGPLMIANPDTKPLTLTVPSYETHNGFIVDSFVSLPEGVDNALYDGRHYPPTLGTLAGTTVLTDTKNGTLAVQTTCAWLLSADDGGGERLVSGPYAGDRTVKVEGTTVNLQLSCADGERAQALVYPSTVYLPLVVRP